MALEKSQLPEFANKLIKKQTIKIGDQGKHLSGGQRQRLALARTFFHNREVIILDEPTSALDEVTEAEILEQISRLRGTVTLIIISHSNKVLTLCDRRYTLKQGRLIN